MTDFGNAFAHTGNTDGGGITGYTVRQVMKAAQISAIGSSYVRATFYAAAGEAFTISKAYIQLSAMTGDAYDFASTPITLTFGGSAGFAITAGNNTVSDKVTLPIPPSTDVIVSCYISGDATHDGFRMQTGIATGNRSYYKLGDDASTVNATGYSTDVNGNVYPVLKLEVAGSDGFWMLF